MSKARKRIIVFGLWSWVFFSIAGCASLGQYNPATGRKEFIIISPSEEVAMGEVIHEEILQQYPLSENQDYIKRIDRIGQRLALVSDRQDYAYHFYVLENDDINAFTTPGGNIYFFTGLLKRMQRDDQAAAVLAHEIGHCAARHTIKKFQAAMGYSLVGGLVLDQLQMGELAKELTVRGTNFAMNIIFSAYSRQDEHEADRLGVKYLYLSGFDLEGMVETLEILKEESEGSSTPLILRSHPYLEDRIKAVKTEIIQVKKSFEENP